MRAIIKSEPVARSELKPGDLFSLVDCDWGNPLECSSSVSVLMRGNSKPEHLVGAADRVFRLTILRDDPAVREKVKCVERELALRRNVYKKRVASNFMSQDVADREIAMMEAIAGDYRAMLPSISAQEPGQ